MCVVGALVSKARLWCRSRVEWEVCEWFCDTLVGEVVVESEIEGVVAGCDGGCGRMWGGCGGADVGDGRWLA